MPRRLVQCSTCPRKFVAGNDSNLLCASCQASCAHLIASPSKKPSIRDVLKEEKKEDGVDKKGQKAVKMTPEAKLPTSSSRIEESIVQEETIPPDKDTNEAPIQILFCEKEEEEKECLSPDSPVILEIDSSSSEDDDDVPISSLKENRENSVQTPAVVAVHPNKVKTASNHNNDNDQLTCQYCGISLRDRGWTNRVQHMKRCAKKKQKKKSYKMESNVGSSSTMEASVAVTTAPKPPATGSSAPKPPASLSDILMAGAKRAAQKVVTTIANKKRPRTQWQQQDNPPTRRMPDFKVITGTDFVCDGFHYASNSTRYFLTHFHSDHYGGITKKWNRGLIYTNAPTAALVQQQLGVDPQYLKILPMDTPVTIGNAQVTLIDANHCPGAIIYLFIVNNKRRIVHVGDFRWHHDTMAPRIRSWLNGHVLDELFLDTTYCQPQYTLPIQDEAIAATVAAVRQEFRHNATGTLVSQRILFLFGAYTIGKERIFLAVARALSKKVYVDTRRYRILQACLDPQDFNLLTKKKEETNIWVAPMGHVGLKRLPEYLSKASVDRVVGFRPTGWSLRAKSDSLVTKATSKDGKCCSYSVPYSEHSSFTELVDCVRSLQPKRIIPTVNVRKSREQIDLLRKPPR